MRPTDLALCSLLRTSTTKLEKRRAKVDTKGRCACSGKKEVMGVRGMREGRGWVGLMALPRTSLRFLSEELDKIQNNTFHHAVGS